VAAEQLERSGEDRRLAQKIGDERDHHADRPPPAELAQQPKAEPCRERPRTRHPGRRRRAPSAYCVDAVPVWRLAPLFPLPGLRAARNETLRRRSSFSMASGVVLDQVVSTPLRIDAPNIDVRRNVEAFAWVSARRLRRRGRS
jgi:hypothetical protein